MNKKSYAFYLIACVILSLPGIISPVSRPDTKQIAGQSQAFLDRVQEELKNLPPHGFGVLEYVRNQTKYSTSLYFDKSIHDALPDNTIVRIKSLDPAQEGKYFTLRDNKDGTLSFKADTTDASDEATKFTIARHLSPNLHDWVGISHPKALNKMMRVDVDNNALAVFNGTQQAFNDETDGVDCHWEIVNSDKISKCSLKSRLSGKLFKSFDGMLDVKIEPDTVKVQTLTDIVGLEPIQFEIIGAWFGSADAIKKIIDLLNAGNAYAITSIFEQVDVTNIIKQWALEKGKISLKENMTASLGVADPAPSLANQAGINLSTMKIQEASQDQQDMLKQTEDMQKQYTAEKVKQFALATRENGKLIITLGDDGKAFNYTIPIDAQKGKMFFYSTSNKSWRGQNLEYNTIVNIYNKNDHPLHYSGEKDQHSSYCVIKSQDKPTQTGPIKYGDKITIHPLWSNDKVVTTPHTLIVSQIGLLGVPSTSPAAKKGDESFTIKSTAGLSGTVCQNDLITIISNSKKDTALSCADNEIALEKEKSGDNNQVFSIRGVLFDIAVQTMYTILGITDYKKFPGRLIQVAIRNNDEIWGINYRGEIWAWNGSSWNLKGSKNYKSISVTQDGDKNKIGTAFAVDADNNIFKRTYDTDWESIPGKLTQISAISPDDIWGIGEDGFVCALSSTGSQWDLNTPSKDVAISTLSTSGSGDVWAVDVKGRIWAYERGDNVTGKWVMKDGPSDKATFSSIAVRNTKDSTGNKKEAWAVSTANKLYVWDGSSWSNIPGKFGSIAVASGVTKQVIPGKTENRRVQSVKIDGAADDPATQIAFEIVQLGMGGNIPSTSEVTCNVAINKKPKVSGFAETRIDQFPQGSKLIVVPLLSKGVAWPEASLQTPGRTTVSFVAKPEDVGDIQVVFGPNISDNYSYKVIIGGSNNTQAEIRQRTIDADGNPQEKSLYAVPKSQNPLAFAPPGVFTPYWVSFDNGFIVVGMGLPGENIFMAQRIKDKVDNINRVGFSSNKGSVEYAEIQFLPPVVTTKLSRTYAQSLQPISVSPQQNPTFTSYPFRIKDFGTIGLNIQGTDNIGIVFAQKSVTDPHYTVMFGSGDKSGISINKYDPQTQKYVTRAYLPKDSFPDIALDPNQARQYWVSFQLGRFIVGLGDIGQTPVMIFQDLNPISDIQSVGYASTSSQPATIKNLTAAPQVSLSLDQQIQSYRTGSKSYQFQGGVTVITPFEYRFTQQDSSILAEDLVSNQTFHPAGTPQQGTLYYYILTINSDGFPAFAPSKTPENATVLKVQQAVTQAVAAAELVQAQSQMEAQEGARLKDLQSSAASIQESQFNAMTSTAKTLTGASGSVAMATGPEPISSMIALGTSISFSLAGTTVAKLAESRLIAAAQEDYKGAQVQALYQQKALEDQSIASKLQFSANLLSGSAQFAFRDPNSYVFVDSPIRASLGSANVPQDAIDNRALADQLMNQATYVKPTSQENFESLLTALQNVIDRINHAYVASDTIKKQFFSCMRGLFDGYNALFSSELDIRVATDFLNLLTSSMNNSYLLDAISDSATRDTWYVWWNKLAHSILMKSPTITLQPAYGEYIWIPIPMKTPDQFALDIEVEGQSDVFIGFSKEQTRVRNTMKDIYEVVLGGWDNTKHAIRIQSLGQSVQEFTKDDYPDTMLLPFESQQYRIMLNKGTVTIQSAGKTMAWTDPYPIVGAKYIGLSTWDMPITFKKINIITLDQALKSPTAPAPTAKPKATTTTPIPAPTRQPEQPITAKKPTPIKPQTSKPVTSTKKIKVVKSAPKKVVKSVVKKATSQSAQGSSQQTAATQKP